MVFAVWISCHVLITFFYCFHDEDQGMLKAIRFLLIKFSSERKGTFVYTDVSTQVV